MPQRLRVCLFSSLLACLSILVPLSHAQSTTTGAISGTVRDGSGGAVGNAKVSIQNEGTNAETKVTADSSGFYNASQLQPGLYTVTVSAGGFSQFKANSVNVAVGESTNLNPVLTVGSV